MGVKIGGQFHRILVIPSHYGSFPDGRKIRAFYGVSRSRTQEIRGHIGRIWDTVFLPVVGSGWLEWALPHQIFPPAFPDGEARSGGYPAGSHEVIIPKKEVIIQAKNDILRRRNEAIISSVWTADLFPDGLPDVRNEKKGCFGGPHQNSRARIPCPEVGDSVGRKFSSGRDPAVMNALKGLVPAFDKYLSIKLNLSLTNTKNNYLILLFS